MTIDRVADPARIAIIAGVQSAGAAAVGYPARWNQTRPTMATMFASGRRPHVPGEAAVGVEHLAEDRVEPVEEDLRQADDREHRRQAQGLLVVDAVVEPHGTSGASTVMTTVAPARTASERVMIRLTNSSPSGRSFARTICGTKMALTAPPAIRM